MEKCRKEGSIDKLGKTFDGMTLSDVRGKRIKSEKIG